MRKLLWVALAATLGACMPAAKKQSVTSAGPDLTSDLSIGCYTVDLFDPYSIQYPTAGVPVEHAKFLGVWQDGAWDKENWCHDLYITEIRADGTVSLMEAYGPNEKRSTSGILFKRQGKIEDGVLSFVGAGQARLRYRLVGSFLVGERQDVYSKMTATLRRTDGIAVVPLPPRNPRRT